MIPKNLVTSFFLMVACATTFSSSSSANAATPDPISPVPNFSFDSTNNSWSFRFPIDSKGNPRKPGQPSPHVFSFGICKGYFQKITREGAYLVWGAQSSCTASDNRYYLHKLRVDLYDSCLYGVCIFFQKTESIVSPASSNYSRVATVNGYDLCRGTKSENSRTYEQRVYVTVRDVKYGPFAQQSGIPYCDINP